MILVLETCCFVSRIKWLFHRLVLRGEIHFAKTPEFQRPYNVICEIRP